MNITLSAQSISAKLRKAKIGAQASETSDGYKCYTDYVYRNGNRAGVQSVTVVLRDRLGQADLKATRIAQVMESHGYKTEIQPHTNFGGEINPRLTRIIVTL